MHSAGETYKIIRRRLFQTLDGEAERARDDTVKAFHDLYRKNPAEFPPEAKEARCLELLKLSYPIHPELFDRLSKDWASLPKFQRTRGVLKFMANVVGVLWHAQVRDPLITPGQVPVAHERVRASVLYPLDAAFAAVVDREVDGDGSLAAQMEEAWRRGHRLRGRQKDSNGLDVPLVSPATVNRSTTQLLQAIFTRAKRFWGARFDNEPNWRHHRLQEPQERVRELADNEADRIEAVLRDDYVPFFDFARASGARLKECLLRRSEVIWTAAQIIKKGKGDRYVVFPITPAVREILWPLQGHHPEMVFTYVAKRTGGGRVKGKSYPMTYSGVKSAWKRVRKAASVSDFRFHDFRHDLGTKLLRETGNLKLVQRALNHADIKTTTRYAHVLTEEVAEALNRVQKSRNQSRRGLRKAG